MELLLFRPFVRGGEARGRGGKKPKQNVGIIAIDVGEIYWGERGGREIVREEVPYRQRRVSLILETDEETCGDTFEIIIADYAIVAGSLKGRISKARHFVA